MGIIAVMRRKGKALLARLPEGTLTVTIVVLACFASYGLGIATGQDTREGKIGIGQVPLMPFVSAPATETPLPITMTAGGQYVASRTGKSYHLPWCSGAKQIKEENKIYFTSKESAEAAGYVAAKNCKGI